MTERIEKRFGKLRRDGRAGLIPFITAGDPDFQTSLEILKGLAGSGADLIELGMPFSDPMADGPAIQASSLRALKAGMTLVRTLEMVRAFRSGDNETPLILMGYFNPLLAYGVSAFAEDARSAGVDGLIIVDVPPEEDDELKPELEKAGLADIRLIAPTSLGKRLASMVAHSSGFHYVISITGVTGTKSYDAADVERMIGALRAASRLPVAVGFGIKTPDQAAEIARKADAAVVGSVVVERIRAGLDSAGRPGSGLVREVLAEVRSFAEAVRSARKH